MKNLKIAFLFELFCAVMVATAARADVWYYNITNNAGRIDILKTGPFLSQSEAIKAAQSDQKEGLGVGPCFSESGDSSVIASSFNAVTFRGDYEAYPQNDLMEKIKQAAAMNPKLEIPEEARGHFIKAGTLLKETKEQSDYELAANEYLAAQKLAPWWPDVYYNLASVREAEKQYDKAINDLNLYLASNPDDARAAQDKLYQIQAEKDLAAKHAADEEHQKQEAREKAQEKIIGSWQIIKGHQMLVISGSAGNFNASLVPETIWNGVANITSSINSFSVEETKISLSVHIHDASGKFADDNMVYDLHSSDDEGQLLGTEEYWAPILGQRMTKEVKLDRSQ